MFQRSRSLIQLLFYNRLTETVETESNAGNPETCQSIVVSSLFAFRMTIFRQNNILHSLQNKKMLGLRYGTSAKEI